MKCPDCGSENPEKAKFCGKCRKPLKGKIIIPDKKIMAAIIVIGVIGALILAIPDSPTPIPALSISPDPLIFELGNISSGVTTVRTYSISNTGQGTLEWNASASHPWITVDPERGVNSGTANVIINTTGLQPGTHSGIITINSNAGHKYGTISFFMPFISQTLAPIASKLKVSGNSLDFEDIIEGQRKAKAFSVYNTGGGTLEWRLDKKEPWIELNLMKGTNNGSVFVTVDTADLSPRNYIGSILVTSNGGNEEVIIEFNVLKATPAQTTPATPTPTPTSTPTSTPAPTINMEFVLIPAGEFDMGSPSSDIDSSDTERPVHHVKISSAFYIGKYEVTQKQWRDVMGTSPSIYRGDDLPVENVSWNDVKEFIGKLNKKEGTDKYRLPSEAEWEYAAWAGTTTRYSFGDDGSGLGKYAWYFDNSGSKTNEVGLKSPNPWGLYDMHGNVWEWVQDNGHDNYLDAPLDGSAWEGSGAGRVLRGGSFGNGAWASRSAEKEGSIPSTRMENLGFRLVRIL